MIFTRTKTKSISLNIRRVLGPCTQIIVNTSTPLLRSSLDLRKKFEKPSKIRYPYYVQAKVRFRPLFVKITAWILVIISLGSPVSPTKWRLRYITSRYVYGTKFTSVTDGWRTNESVRNNKKNEINGRSISGLARNPRITIAVTIYLSFIDIISTRCTQ